MLRCLHPAACAAACLDLLQRKREPGVTNTGTSQPGGSWPGATLYFVSKAAFPLLSLPAPGRGGQAAVSQPGARQGCSPRSNGLVPKPQGRAGGSLCLAKDHPPSAPGSGVEAKLEVDTATKIRPTREEAGELETGHFKGFC